MTAPRVVRSQQSLWVSSVGFLLVASFLCVPVSLYCQSSIDAMTPAMPYFEIPSSPTGVGLGGSAAILPTVDPAATLDNPAQLGLFALTNTFSVATFAPKTVYFEGFSSPFEPNPTLDLTALSAGINLANILPVPVPLSLGLGYSRSSFDLGYYAAPPSGFPDVISPPIMWGTHPVARVESFSFQRKIYHPA